MSVHTSSASELSVESAELAPVQVPLVAWLFAALAASVVYLAFNENGAVLANSWEMTHEFFHDGRHVFGVPCH